MFRLKYTGVNVKQWSTFTTDCAMDFCEAYTVGYTQRTAE